MRAKAVNEVQNFEKGQSPKKAMGIGGLDLNKDFQNRIEKYKQVIDGTTLSHTDEWIEFLSDNLRGKKITAYMRKMSTMNVSSNKKEGLFNSGEHTIEVQDILPSWGIKDDFSEYNSDNPLRATPPQLIVADMDNNMYQMSMDQKIYIN